MFCSVFNRRCNRVFFTHTVQERRVYMCTITLPDFTFFATRQNRNNIQTKFFRKIPVTTIMCRHRHNRTESIICQNIVRNKDWNFTTIKWICRHNAIQTNTCFFTRNVCAFDFGLGTCRGNVSVHCICIFNLARIQPFFDQRVFRCQHTERYTEYCINTRCINSHNIIANLEIDICAMRTTNPVYLFCFNAFWIVNQR